MPKSILLLMLLIFLVDVEPSDRLSENQSHRRQAISRVKSPAVLISPVRDSMVLEKRRAES